MIDLSELKATVKQNIDFEMKAWLRDGIIGNSSGPRYVLDTVIHHEHNTDALYKIERGLEIARDKDVLEVGCNCGGFCFLFAKTAKSVTGLDLLPGPIEYARKFRDRLNARDFSEETWGESWCHPPDWKVENTGFVQGNGYDLPMREESYDVVFMYSCIEHFPKHQRLRSVEEAKRVTRTGGLVVISTITDVDNNNREAWLKQIAEEVHPFGLCQLADILNYAKEAKLGVIEAQEIWFGDENKIKLAFVVLQKG